MTWENIVVGVILLIAAGLLSRHFYRQWKGRQSCCSERGCALCWSPDGKMEDACPASRAAAALEHGAAGEGKAPEKDSGKEA